MKKLPAVYIYKRTSDKGMELKYSMRSLGNVLNWNGEVFVSGDREDWMSEGVQLIDGFARSHEKFTDYNNRLRAVIADERVQDVFICLHDDMYITQPTEIEAMHDGYLVEYSGKNRWLSVKAKSKNYLESRGVKNPKNYDIHVPIIFEKEKLAHVLGERELHQFATRSVYGSLYFEGARQYKDRKTQTSKLKTGAILSTRLFTEQLRKLFPDKSPFEK